MKKLLMLISVIVTLFYGCLIACDVPSDKRTISQNLALTNVSAFPDYAIILYQSGPLSEERIEIIEDNKVIHGSAPSSSSYILTISKSLFEQYGGFHNIDFKSLTEDRTCSLISQIVPRITVCGTVDVNCTGIESDTYFYEIQSINDNNMTSKLVKRVIDYSDREDQTLFYQ